MRCGPGLGAFCVFPGTGLHIPANSTARWSNKVGFIFPMDKTESSLRIMVLSYVPKRAWSWQLDNQS
jgi:hypothetical protein